MNNADTKQKMKHPVNFIKVGFDYIARHTIESVGIVAEGAIIRTMAPGRSYLVSRAECNKVFKELGFKFTKAK